MRITSLITLFFVLFFIPSTSFSQTISDYLILQDIGPFKLDRPEKMLPGRPPIGGPEIYNNSSGVIGAADHFSLDHTDTTYKVMYIGGNGIPSPTVQVTKHSGTDSDKWLLHEVESNFRKNPEQDNFRGVMREINGNRIFTYVRGTHYNWISNNIVVDIRYTDLQKTKPEPLEVISAYLQKHPSTIPAMVMDKAHDVQWIKDEMERRLWLGDKWFMQLQLKKAEEKQVYQESVKSMNVFLDYREKYYGLKAADEKNLLSGYLNTNNGTGIKAKLTEYKNWWTMNKDKAITL